MSVDFIYERNGWRWRCVVRLTQHAWTVGPLALTKRGARRKASELIR